MFGLALLTRSHFQASKVTKLELFFDAEGFLKTVEGTGVQDTLAGDLKEPMVDQLRRANSQAQIP